MSKDLLKTIKNTVAEGDTDAVKDAIENTLKAEISRIFSPIVRCV